ncbi:N-acetyltransferase [Pigmentiphaga aceris]|uniref:N-acetyltransferase n=1 Tax=Pigmentiphaga aceris TaxID=1940612 RepID=A0A5C0B1Q6_9BURK|nr:N-acetyltransferase [Pigmentiphaga aceris]
MSSVPGVIQPESVQSELVQPEVVQPKLVLRDSEALDVPAIQAIYAHHVLHGTSSFEIDPPSLRQMQQRREEVLALGLPYLVVERDGEVVGYAYASLYRPRPGYRFTIEDSIYLRDGCTGQGIGSLLLAALIERCAQAGWRQMVAVAGGAGAASIALHKRHGFELTGILRAVGFKFGEWRDCALLQRSLGDGDASLPTHEAGARSDVEVVPFKPALASDQATENSPTPHASR